MIDFGADLAARASAGHRRASSFGFGRVGLLTVMLPYGQWEYANIIGPAGLAGADLPLRERSYEGILPLVVVRRYPILPVMAMGGRLR